MENLAAIICSHIGREGAPILKGKKDFPMEEVDSGWQFVCGSEEEDPEKAMVVGLSTILKIEPSLAPFLESQAGTIVYRDAPNSSWAIHR